MLIKMATLRRIRSGEVTIVFRRWKRPTVKARGTLQTAVGQLAIENVEPYTLNQITGEDVKLAGYASKRVLTDELSNRQGQLYRITLGYSGADPRVSLRQRKTLSEQDWGDLLKRLRRMDSRSSRGEWTLNVLSAIEQNPKQLAADLANQLGYEKDWLKTAIRKLKNLGMTVSHQQGYTLSPRGVIVLERLRNES